MCVYTYTCIGTANERVNNIFYVASCDRQVVTANRVCRNIIKINFMCVHASRI